MGLDMVSPLLPRRRYSTLELSRDSWRLWGIGGAAIVNVSGSGAVQVRRGRLNKRSSRTRNSCLYSLPGSSWNQVKHVRALDKATPQRGALLRRCNRRRRGKSYTILHGAVPKSRLPTQKWASLVMKKRHAFVIRGNRQPSCFASSKREQTSAVAPAASPKQLHEGRRFIQESRR